MDHLAEIAAMKRKCNNSYKIFNRRHIETETSHACLPELTMSDWK
jgi:hypothetical protein